MEYGFEFVVKIVVVVLLALFFIARSRFTKHYNKFTPMFLIKYVVFIALMVVYFMGWFDFAQFEVNVYFRIIGGLVLIFLGLALFFWTHAHLGKNWSPIIEKKFAKSRRLVKSGPYRYIRHPTYSASIVTLIGFFVFTGNWLLTGIPLLILIFFYSYKIPREEDELVRNFGKDYVSYMQSTPRFVPGVV